MPADRLDLQKRLAEIDRLYLAAEELAENLDDSKLHQAAAYVSMGLDVIRDVRKRLAALP